ncbi:hypothetical protein Dsin_022667 [Dipteronia sinensis]|uniref:Uncharacterized protein n=1 Tax=Dipteronia sinensis TaxID=43782 RepID=A0AAE0A2W0_9ROSI|nr:hypothetical protein Dsin_022667 [Dipteronia sinensis]
MLWIIVVWRIWASWDRASPGLISGEIGVMFRNGSTEAFVALDGSSPLSMANVVTKIKRCTSQLTVWNAKNQGRLKKDMDACKQALNKANNNILLESWQDIRRIENKFDALIEKDEAYWQQRSRTKWLKSGDRNSYSGNPNLFHDYI